MRFGTGGTVTRVAQNGAGGGGGSGVPVTLLSVSGYPGGGGGVWNNGYVGSVNNGLAGNGQAEAWTGGSASLPLTNIVATSGGSAIFTIGSNYPVDAYLGVGQRIFLTGLTGSGISTYNGSQTITAISKANNTFSISGSSNVASTAITASVAPTFVGGGSGGGNSMPSSSSYRGARGGQFGGGGGGNNGAGGGGGTVWVDQMSVVPGTVYQISAGVGGQSYYGGTGTVVAYSTDGGGGHGMIRIMYGQNKYWPNNVS